MSPLHTAVDTGSSSSIFRVLFSNDEQRMGGSRAFEERAVREKGGRILWEEGPGHTFSIHTDIYTRDPSEVRGIP